MAYEEQLAERIREMIAARGIEHDERHMFGGLAFLVDGNMALAASSHDGIMVRVDPDRTEHLVETTVATAMEMRGRTLSGWIRVAPDHVIDEGTLAEWVGIGLDRARALPSK